MATQPVNRSLAEQDPEIFALINSEKKRQIEGIELIASENFTSRAVMEALGSCLTNKYSEGYPGQRYYGGNEYIDQIENLCIKRALNAFKLDGNDWGVNVQPYSGSPANFAVYTGVIRPHDRIMGLDLPNGGHLTHGFFTPTRKVSATSIFFESMPYRTNVDTGLVDFEQLRASALLFRPQIIICGGSAYPRDWDYEQFRIIADEVGALLMCDMAHYAGLVAGGHLKSPFEYADIVTTTTHKTLRGPRSGMIFYRKGVSAEVVAASSPQLKKRQEKWATLGSNIAQAVFPGLQGGPHNHQIAGVAVQMAEVATSEWVEYSKNVIESSRALADELLSHGFKIVSGGSDTHLVLWDLRPTGISGGKFQLLCDQVAITLNKNAVPGDISALNPGGVRIGTSAMTTRGVQPSAWKEITTYLVRVLEIAKEIENKAKETSPKVMLAQFTHVMNTDTQILEQIKALKHDVETWSSGLYMPGV